MQFFSKKTAGHKSQQQESTIDFLKYIKYYKNISQNYQLYHYLYIAN